MDKTMTDHQEHILETIASLRGDLPDELGAVLVLTILGTHHLANSLNPDEQARTAAARAFDAMLYEDLQGGGDLQRLARDVLTPHVASSEPSLEVLCGAALESQSYRSAISGGLVRRIATAQRGRQRDQSAGVEAWRTAGQALADTVLSGERYGRSGALSQQTGSETLNGFIARLAQDYAPRRPSTIGDLFAGTGGTLAAVSRVWDEDREHDSQEVEIVQYAQDVNRVALFLTAWRLALHGVRAVHLGAGNAFIETAFRDAKGRSTRVDLVVGTPPLGISVVGNELNEISHSDARGRYPYGLSRTGDWLFPQAALASVKADGLVIITVPPGALSRSLGTEAQIRTSLIKSDQVCAVFLLPGGLLTTTSLQVAVLVLQPKKPEHLRNEVLLADLSTFGPDELLEALVAILNGTMIGPAARNGVTVTSEDVLRQDASLLPTIYLPPPDIRSTLRLRDEAAVIARNAVKQIKNAGDELLRALDLHEIKE